MKKVILSLSGILLAAFMVIMAVNAQDNTQEVKKANTTVTKSCEKGTSATAACCEKAAETAKCDPAKCKEAKCDPATCKTACAESKCAAKKCDQSAGKKCAEK